MSTIWEVDDADEEIEGLDAAGRPDPLYAAALGLIPAPFGRRSLAVAIDLAAYVLVQIPFWAFAFPLLLMFLRSEITLYGLVQHPHFLFAVIMAGVSTLLMLALLITQGAFHGRMGVTIGKAFTGIRGINAKLLGRPGFWRMVLRTLIVGASGILPLIGPALFFLSALRDPEKRGRAWHDHASQVWLIDVRNGLDPYDAKRMRIARKVVKVEIAPQALELPSLASVEGGGIQPGYRPAHSVSASVLGAAKSRRAGRDDSVGIVARHVAEVPPAQVGERGGAPVVGGYRADRGSAGSTPGGPLSRTPEDHGLVLRVPADLAAAPAPAPAPAPAATPAPAPAGANPAPAPAPASPPRPEAHRAEGMRVTLDSGDQHVIAGPTIIGRNPDSTPYGDVHRVAVPDDTRSVSKTHFALRPVSAGVEIRDLGSTNGTFIVHGDVERQVTAATSHLAVPGDVVRFGDRTMRIGG